MVDVERVTDRGREIERAAAVRVTTRHVTSDVERIGENIEGVTGSKRRDPAGPARWLIRRRAGDWCCPPSPEAGRMVWVMMVREGRRG